MSVFRCRTISGNSRSIRRFGKHLRRPLTLFEQLPKCINSATKRLGRKIPQLVALGQLSSVPVLVMNLEHCDDPGFATSHELCRSVSSSLIWPRTDDCRAQVYYEVSCSWVSHCRLDIRPSVKGFKIFTVKFWQLTLMKVQFITFALKAGLYSDPTRPHCQSDRCKV